MLTATLPALDPPLANAISRAEPSSLTVLVTNTGTQIVREVDIQLPSQYGSVTSAIVPDGTWSVTPAGGVAPFLASCSGPGIPPNDSATFVIKFQGPATSNNGDNPASSPFSVTGSTSSGPNVCDPSPASQTVTFTAPVKALYITGAVALRSSTQATVSWTVTNNNSTQTVNNVAINTVVTPSTGWSTSNCTTTIPSINVGGPQAQTASCRYTFTVPGTYTFTASARDGNGTGTSSAAGTTAGTFTYSTVPIVTWSQTVAVKGLTSNTLTLNVAAPSSANVTRIDVYNDSSSGWTLSTTPAGGSATNGLIYQAPPTSTAADVVFTGTLNKGFSTDIIVTYSGVPNIATGQNYPFHVKVTYGATLTTPSQSVWLDVPIPDVSQLTIRNDSSGKLLTWTNTSGNGATHDGVVIFREPSGTDPAKPDPFRVYSVGENRVVFFTSGGSTASSFSDPTPGSFNYRVCNHDAYYVYSSCSTGFWNNAGWLDSETYPTGGWVHAIAGQALLRPGLITGGRIGIASNAPDITVLDAATGARSFAPVTVPSLLTAYTPAVILTNGMKVLYAADQSGVITAINLDTGGVYWQKTKAGENFTAGVSGITQAGGSAAFKAAYPNMDIVLIGSTTGTVYAINCNTGDTLWTLSAGAGIYGLLTYDPLTNVFWVPTAGAGVKAYTLTGSSPTVAATPVSGWTNPTGSFKLTCVRTASSAGIACLNTSGTLYVMNKTTGALQASAFPTGITSPTGLARISGTGATSGLVVSSASSIQVVSATGTPYTLKTVGTWTPTGVTLSTPSVYADSGFLVVGGSDLVLHRISLATATQQATSPQITTWSTGGIKLAQPVFDTSSGLYLFSTSDGHVWALPSF